MKLQGKQLLVACLCLIVTLSACTPTVSANQPTNVILGTSSTVAAMITKAEKPADISGIWLISFPDYKPADLVIRLDETYSISPNTDGSHGQSGNYQFVKGTFHIQNTICGQDSQYTVIRETLSGKPDSLLFSPVQAPCQTLTNFLTQPAPTWVGPVQ